MLYWHFGQRRTGTTSLQTALVVNQERLAEVGLVYPDAWRVPGLAGFSTHHGLTEVIESDRDEAPARHFREYLAEHAGESVLLSSEFVEEWIAGPRLEPVLETLAMAQAITPVRGIWTLRRIDEVVGSLALRRVLAGVDSTFPSPAEVPHLAASFSTLLAGMHRVEGALGGAVVYAKYDRDGAHNGQILRAVGLPREVCSQVEGSLARGPRLNPQMTYKGSLALRFRDLISKRCGTAIDEPDLKRALFLGDFTFADDRPCELMGHQVRRALHGRALAAARDHGIDDYVRFFEDDEIEPSAPVSMDPDALTDADLEQLLTYLRAIGERDVESTITRRFRPLDSPTP
jgi:hypothetical protein